MTKKKKNFALSKHLEIISFRQGFNFVHQASKQNQNKEGILTNNLR